MVWWVLFEQSSFQYFNNVLFTEVILCHLSPHTDLCIVIVNGNLISNQQKAACH